MLRFFIFLAGDFCCKKNTINRGTEKPCQGQKQSTSDRHYLLGLTKYWLSAFFISSGTYIVVAGLNVSLVSPEEKLREKYNSTSSKDCS
jgi:hypothetical protein